MSLLGANSAIIDGKYELATDILTSSIKREPKFFKSYYVRGQIYLIQGKHREAYNDLVICDYLCPDFAMTRKLMGYVE